MTLSTRKPTGEAGWPSLLVEGREGAGKTYSALRLSADPRVGGTFVIECGERRADEYAPLGDFEIVDHDGTIGAVVAAIGDVLLQPPRDGKPNVLVLDSATHLWDLCKREANRIARSSRSAKERLEKDENAEIDVGHQAWNKAEDRYWWSWVNDLRAWPGVALLTARSDEVSKFVNGKPVANQTEYRVDVQKGTPFALDGTVRMRAGKPCLVTTAKSLNFQVPDGGVEADDLAAVVFDLFAAGLTVELSEPQAKRSLLAYVRGLGVGDEAQTVAASVWKSTAGNRSRFGADLIAKLCAAADAEADALLKDAGSDRTVPAGPASTSADPAASQGGET